MCLNYIDNNIILFEVHLTFKNLKNVMIIDAIVEYINIFIYIYFL